MPTKNKIKFEWDDLLSIVDTLPSQTEKVERLKKSIQTMQAAEKYHRKIKLRNPEHDALSFWVRQIKSHEKESTKIAKELKLI